MKTEHASAQYLKDYKKPEFLVQNVVLTFYLDGENTKVINTTEYYRAEAGANKLVLNGEHQQLERVELDGRQLTASEYQITNETLTLTDLPEQFVLTTESLIDPVNNTALEGLYLSGGAYCTQCEAQGFRRITYFQDRPDVLGAFTTHIIADKSMYPHLLSNGNKVAEETLPSGLTKVTWVDPFKKPCYLFALVAGDFDVLQDSFNSRSGRNIQLELFVDKGNLGRAEHAMASLKAAMAWDEQRFSLEYDLDIYMIVAVDFFNMGAMENKGLNVFNSKCVLADRESATDADYLSIESIVGHEYFHNWTGNRVTCRDWFQLSLKEGLTVFRDQEFSMDLGSRAVNRIQQVRIMREHQFAEDASPMSHPIRPDAVIEMNNFYTVTVYDKGAEVIRMLHSILGEDKFQQGMALYFERFDGQAVTCDDFVDAMQDASGLDLSQFRLWYSQSGTPVVSVSSEYNQVAQTLTLTLQQMTHATFDQVDKAPLHIPVKIAFYYQDGQPAELTGGAEQVLNLTQAEQSFTFACKQPVYFSLLRDFSAPVKLNYQYSDAELSCLIPAETSDYAKWELMQNLYIKYLCQDVKGELTEYPVEIAQVLRALLADESLDKALLAEILTVPSFSSLLEYFEQVNPQKIIRARQSLQVYLVDQIGDSLYRVWQQATPTDYQYNASEIARRSLWGASLKLLAMANYADIGEQLGEFYQGADNMTDRLSILQAAGVSDKNVFKQLMDDFDQSWRGDSLVMDKWFALQAKQDTDEIFTNIEKLQSHPDFNWNNPNKVRALFGQFAMFNHAQFHRSDGRGYQLVSRAIEKLNAINPQVAARMITPLIQYHKLDLGRQTLIKSELQRLSALDGLSSDLYEKISKSLAS
ncbi:aminopeptidase N [Gayadomonas joobiniege]|uniref:aminopeptidase N n=1 Tax=Gayadomonas joobiniege TaxID=1234606 RepID=UPI0003814088|nr:aminopeptidase N [Gayadomonas joobiniege]